MMHGMMMHGPMAWGMGFVCILLLLVLALGAVALVKYLFSPRSR